MNSDVIQVLSFTCINTQAQFPSLVCYVHAIDCLALHAHIWPMILKHAPINAQVFSHALTYHWSLYTHSHVTGLFTRTHISLVSACTHLLVVSSHERTKHLYFHTLTYYWSFHLHTYLHWSLNMHTYVHRVTELNFTIYIMRRFF